MDFSHSKEYRAGLTWWYSGEEATCQCRGHRFHPWSGKFPHASGKPSPCITMTDPCTVTTGACEPRARRGHHSEKPAHRNDSSPHSPQLEKSPRSKRRPSTAEKKERKKRTTSVQNPALVTSRLCDRVSFLHASVSSSGKWNYNRTPTFTGLHVLRTLGT